MGLITAALPAPWISWQVISSCHALPPPKKAKIYWYLLYLLKNPGFFLQQTTKIPRKNRLVHGDTFFLMAYYIIYNKLHCIYLGKNIFHNELNNQRSAVFALLNWYPSKYMTCWESLLLKLFVGQRGGSIFSRFCWTTIWPSILWPFAMVRGFNQFVEFQSLCLTRSQPVTHNSGENGRQKNTKKNKTIWMLCWILPL